MIAISNARVYTISKGVIERGTVLVDGGRISAVGADLRVPEGADVIDASGRSVFPGFVDPHTHVGIREECLGWEGDDVNETTDPVTPHLRAVDAVFPRDEGLAEALRGGVTAVWSGPGSANVIGGEGVTMRTHGRSIDEMVMKCPSGLKAAFGENPKRVYGEKQRMPSTRMGVAAVMRQAFAWAAEYVERRAADVDLCKKPEIDLRAEALARVLRREIPLRAHAHRADDILTALRIGDEFQIDLCIEHCTEGHLVADELARRGVPAVVGPSLSARTKVELKERSFRTPAVLAEAGVKVGISTDHPVIPLAYLRIAAALAHLEGMSEEDALKSITLNAADIAGVSDRIGSIEPGKDADLVVWEGHPFELRARPREVLVRGEVVHRDAACAPR